MVKHSEKRKFISSNIEFYDRLAPTYKQIYVEINSRAIVRQWVTLLEKLKCIPAVAGGADRKMRLIDIGCGPGWHLPEWSSAGFKVAGLDSSQEMLKLAREHFRSFCPEVDCPLYQVDIREVDEHKFESQFDIAVSHFNFLNLFAPEQLLDVFIGVRKLLRHGGVWVTDFCQATEILDDFDGEVGVEPSYPPVRRSRRFLQQEGCYAVRLSGKNIDITEKYWLKNLKSIVKAANQLNFKSVGIFEWEPNGGLWESAAKDPVTQLLAVFRSELFVDGESSQTLDN